MELVGLVSPSEDNEKCGTDVLLQLILSKDLANELAYVSVAGDNNHHLTWFGICVVSSLHKVIAANSCVS